MRTYQLLLILHILAATIWTGGHLILSFRFLPEALKHGRLDALQDFETRFERIGIPALLIQVITGFWLAYRHIPSLTGWFRFDSVSSTHIACKLLFLLLTVGFALHARLRLVPQLQHGRIRALAFHIIAVTTLSVLFVLFGIGLRTGGLF